MRETSFETMGFFGGAYCLRAYPWYPISKSKPPTTARSGPPRDSSKGGIQVASDSVASKTIGAKPPKTQTPTWRNAGHGLQRYDRKVVQLLVQSVVQLDGKIWTDMEILYIYIYVYIIYIYIYTSRYLATGGISTMNKNWD